MKLLSLRKQPSFSRNATRARSEEGRLFSQARNCLVYQRVRRVRRGGAKTTDLRPTTPDRCRLRTNVLPGEERFDKGFEENRISHELLRYLKQQTLMVSPPISEMQRKIIWIISYIVQTLERTKKRSSTCSCKTSFLTIKTSSNLWPEATIPTQPQESNQISTNSN